MPVTPAPRGHVMHWCHLVVTNSNAGPYGEREERWGVCKRTGVIQRKTGGREERRRE